MADLARMRLTFEVAAVWGDWSAEYQAELGAEIRWVIDAGDTAAIEAWAEELEQLSGLARMAALCRAAEQRIHAGSASA